MVIRTISKNLGENLIYGGHLISFGAVGIVLTFILLVEENILIIPLLIVYFLTFVSLLHNRYKEKELDFLTNPKRTRHLEKYFRKITIIIFIIGVSSILVLVINGSKEPLFFLLLLAAVIFLYTKYLKKLTRKILGFKNIIFSLITSSLLIFTSLYYSYDFLSFTLWSIFIFCFLRMMVNTIFLDIKDVESDRREGLKTIPIIFGHEKTLWVLKIISLLSGLLLMIFVILDFIPVCALTLLLVVPYSFYYFKLSTKKRNFYLVNYILADAEFILWPIGVIIGKILL